MVTRHPRISHISSSWRHVYDVSPAAKPGRGTHPPDALALVLRCRVRLRAATTRLSFRKGDVRGRALLPSTAPQRRSRPPTRPSHPAGRASTGSWLLHAHSGGASTCQTSSGSKSAQELVDEQPPRARAELDERKFLARGASLAEFVRDQRRSPKPRPPRAPTSCGAGCTDGPIDAYDQRCWVGR